jgi:hypothetical protein
VSKEFLHGRNPKVSCDVGSHTKDTLAVSNAGDGLLNFKHKKDNTYQLIGALSALSSRLKT